MKTVNPQAYRQLAEAIEALDFSEENAELEVISQEIEAVRGSAVKAETEASKLAQEIHEFSGPAPELVADALLAGVAPSEAARLGPSKEELVSQKQALQSSASNLRERERALRQRKRALEDSAKTKVAHAVQPFVADIERVINEAAEEIVSAFASLRILSETTGSFALQNLAVREAREGIMGPDRILPFRNKIAIPPGLSSALSQLEDKGVAFPAKIREEVQVF